MSASREIGRYTELWAPMFNKFSDNPEEEVRVNCGTLKEARSLRLEFYKAREAQKHESLKPGNEGLYPVNLDRKEVRIEGTTVVFGYKEENRIAQLLKAAIADPANKIEHVDLKAEPKE